MISNFTFTRPKFEGINIQKSSSRKKLKTRRELDFIMKIKKNRKSLESEKVESSETTTGQEGFSRSRKQVKKQYSKNRQDTYSRRGIPITNFIKKTRSILEFLKTSNTENTNQTAQDNLNNMIFKTFCLIAISTIFLLIFIESSYLNPINFRSTRSYSIKDVRNIPNYDSFKNLKGRDLTEALFKNDQCLKSLNEYLLARGVVLDTSSVDGGEPQDGSVGPTASMAEKIVQDETTTTSTTTTTTTTSTQTPTTSTTTISISQPPSKPEPPKKIIDIKARHSNLKLPVEEEIGDKSRFFKNLRKKQLSKKEKMELDYEADYLLEQKKGSEKLLLGLKSDEEANEQHMGEEELHVVENLEAENVDYSIDPAKITALKHSLEGLITYTQTNKTATNEILDLIHLALQKLDTETHSKSAETSAENEVKMQVMEELHSNSDQVAEDVEEVIRKAKHWSEVVLENDHPVHGKSKGHLSKRLKVAKDLNLLDKVLEIDVRNAKYKKFLKEQQEETNKNHKDGPEIQKQKTLPKLIIIGVKKCGTGAISNFLDIHPQAKFAGEIYYFNREFETKSVNWYKSNMPSVYNGTLVFEKTPDYIFYPDIPERIHNYDKEAKVIAVLCDPVKRVLSDFLHMNRHNTSGQDTKIFTSRVLEGMSKIHSYEKLMKESNRDWFELFLALRNKFAVAGVLKTFAPVILRSAYSVYLNQWFKYFKNYVPGIGLLEKGF